MKLKLYKCECYFANKPIGMIEYIEGMNYKEVHQKACKHFKQKTGKSYIQVLCTEIKASEEEVKNILKRVSLYEEKDFGYFDRYKD